MSALVVIVLAAVAVATLGARALGAPRSEGDVTDGEGLDDGDEPAALDAPASPTQRWTNVDLVHLRVTLDPRRAGEVLRAIPADAAIHGLGLRHLRRLAQCCRRQDARARTLGGDSFRPMSPAMAVGMMAGIEARAGRWLERVRDLRTETDDYRAMQGSARLAVVSILVVSRAEIRDFDPSRVSEIVRTLGALTNTPSRAFVAARVGWTLASERTDALAAWTAEPVRSTPRGRVR